MHSQTFVQVIDLLARSKQSGLRLFLNGDQLSINFPKGLTPDQTLLGELKSNKSAIIDYFRRQQLDMQKTTSPKLTPAEPVLSISGKKFYGITPVQNYWVDRNWDKDFKELVPGHGVSLNTWYITGEFDPLIFKAAVRNLITRHESLRATFHCLEGQYLMSINDSYSSLYEMELIDVADRHLTSQELEKLEAFQGHCFDFENGPLILVRLIRTSTTSYIISIKIAHVVTDLWSHDILLRDLLVAYRDLRVGKNIDLPAMTFQLKDYNYFVIKESRENYDRDKRYWESLYNFLPPELKIPGARKSFSPLKDKMAGIEVLQLPSDTVNVLTVFAKKFSCTTFIIFQAFFKSFLELKTKQTDLVIGTYVFGRKFADSEDQIGCYSYTVIIRTLLESNEPIERIIQKVKKSNDDMQSYTAYTLMQRCEAMLRADQKISGTFWKINLVYNDTDVVKSYTEQSNSVKDLGEVLDVKVRAKEYKTHPYIPIDMHWDIYRSRTGMAVQIQYDTSLYEAVTIKTFANEFFAHINKKVQEFSTGNPLIQD
jgi:Condensation domain/TubC N-terminal docking domain